jgi:hypothetical protein
VQLLCRFNLRTPLIVFRLRDDTVGKQRMNAGELGFGEIERGLGVGDVGHALEGEIQSTGVNREPRFDLRRVGFCLLQLCPVSVGERVTNSAPAATADPRSTGVSIESVGIFRGTEEAAKRRHGGSMDGRPQDAQCDSGLCLSRKNAHLSASVEAASAWLGM